MFNHDDSVNDRSDDSKLSKSDKKTREMWMEEFGEEFPVGGAMYRGNPPDGKLQKVTADEIFAVSSKTAEVTINSLKIENIVEDQKFVLKVNAWTHFIVVQPVVTYAHGLAYFVFHAWTCYL